MNAIAKTIIFTAILMLQEGNYIVTRTDKNRKLIVCEYKTSNFPLCRITPKANYTDITESIFTTQLIKLLIIPNPDTVQSPPFTIHYH